MVQTYPGRSLLGLTLMVSQAFLYNAIFFTYALVLTKFYGVPSDRTGLYLLPFAVGNFFGPVLLGRLLRHGRPQADDRGDVFDLGRLAGDHRLAVRPRTT